MKEEDLIQYFMNPKKAKAIVAIRRNQREGIYTRKMSQKIGTTNSHACHIISGMSEKGLVVKEEEGRRKKLKLTDKGQAVADSIGQFFNLVEERFELSTGVEGSEENSESQEVPDYLKTITENATT